MISYLGLDTQIAQGGSNGVIMQAKIEPLHQETIILLTIAYLLVFV